MFEFNLRKHIFYEVKIAFTTENKLKTTPSKISAFDCIDGFLITNKFLFLS